MRPFLFTRLVLTLTARGVPARAADDKPSSDADQPPAKSPEESWHSIKVRPGFEVELVAAEPLVQSPIHFAWGPDGKPWVVETDDYPLGVDGKGKPGGRIKILEDTQ
jgi:hypothetical protein